MATCMQYVHVYVIIITNGTHIIPSVLSFYLFVFFLQPGTTALLKDL